MKFIRILTTHYFFRYRLLINFYNSESIYFDTFKWLNFENPKMFENDIHLVCKNDISVFRSFDRYNFFKNNSNLNSSFIPILKIHNCYDFTLIAVRPFTENQYIITLCKLNIFWLSTFVDYMLAASLLNIRVDSLDWLRQFNSFNKKEKKSISNNEKR